jgi:nitroreductase
LADHPWRLVVVGERETDGEIIAEVAHEALLQSWPRLGEWLREEREFLVLKGDVERAQRRWRDMDCSEKALLTGLDLARAEEWLPNRTADLSPEVTTFVHESIEADRAQKQRLNDAELTRERLAREKADDAAKAAEALVSAARRTTRRTLIGSAVSLVFFAVAALFGWQVFEQQKAADLQRAPMETQRVAAEIERAIASESLSETSRTLLEVGNITQALQSTTDALRLSQAQESLFLFTKPSGKLACFACPAARR